MESLSQCPKTNIKFCLGDPSFVCVVLPIIMSTVMKKG